MFHSKKGHIFAFGRNAISGKDDPFVFSWDDPKTKIWQMEVDNEAGSMLLAKPIPNEISIVDLGDKIEVTGDDFSITINYVGDPFVWGVTGPSAIHAEAEGVRK